MDGSWIIRVYVKQRPKPVLVPYKTKKGNILARYFLFLYIKMCVGSRDDRARTDDLCNVTAAL